MRNILKSLILSCLVLTLLPSVCFSEGNENVFTDRAVGFSVTKPSTWVFVSKREIEENRERVKINNEELERRIKEKASLPLVAFVKYPEPYENLNPSFQVVISPLGQLSDKSPAEILPLVIATLKKAFAEFTIVEDVKSLKISGLDAAGFKASYKVATSDGREFKTLSRMYLVTRGTVAFTISMSGTAEGVDVSEAAFSEILSSIKISK